MHTWFFLVLAAGAIFVWWSAGALPDVVASHFGAGGAANGFMSRGEYVGFMLVLVLLVPAFIYSLGWLAALLPVQFVNLPNKNIGSQPSGERPLSFPSGSSASVPAMRRSFCFAPFIGSWCMQIRSIHRTWSKLRSSVLWPCTYWHCSSACSRFSVGSSVSPEPSIERTFERPLSPLGPPLMSNIRSPMRHVGPSLVAFVVGCILWWLGVYLDGFLAAQSWPAFVVALSKRSPMQALYFWQVVMYFAPMFLAVCLAGFVLFRMVGAGRATLLASVVPYAVLSGAMGSFERVSFSSWLSSSGLLSLIALSSSPLGLFVAWLLVRRGHTTPPPSGQPPAGFAV
ncbi:MAG: DUF1648 domain-containing protein [Caldimonas sp.]